MPYDPGVVSDESIFALQIGRRKIPLSAAQGFGLAEDLIRGATRRLIVDEASRAQVLDAVSTAAASAAADRKER